MNVFSSFKYLSIYALFLALFYLLPNLEDVPGGSALKSSPSMQETQEKWDGSLGQEDALEKGNGNLL